MPVPGRAGQKTDKFQGSWLIDALTYRSHSNVLSVARGIGVSLQFSQEF